MVTINISSSGYDFRKTAFKLLREFSIWVLPQILNLVVTGNPEFANMSIAALASIGLKTLQDYLKHS